MATQNYSIFNCFNRKFTVTEPGPPSDVQHAFSHFSGDAPSMSADDLRRFLTEHQGELDLTASDLDRIIQQLRKEDHESHIANTTSELTLRQFFHFLFFHHFNSPLNSQVHHDMKAPLSHYFIYTGHNSYLTGNQLSSDCSDEPIIEALQRGVRVIELDLWPNSTEDDIIVVHGRC